MDQSCSQKEEERPHTHEGHQGHGDTEDISPSPALARIR